MCWFFYMGIAQIALDPPLCQTGKPGKNAPNYPGKPLYPKANVEKSAPNHPGKPLHLLPYGQCPYKTNTFQREASLIEPAVKQANQHITHCPTKPFCCETLSLILRKQRNWTEKQFATRQRMQVHLHPGLLGWNDLCSIKNPKVRSWSVGLAEMAEV